jgi:hypothetical protein
MTHTLATVTSNANAKKLFGFKLGFISRPSTFG